MKAARHGGISHSPGGRLTPRHRWSVLIAFGAAWITGVLGLWAVYIGRRAGEFGPEPHWIESSARAAHGLAAMACLAVLGSLLPRHVPSGWASKEKRFSSLLLTVAVIALVLTGWAMYYTGADAERSFFRWIHIIVGSLLPLPLILHAIRHKKPPR